jgi:hypothetical protein
VSADAVSGIPGGYTIGIQNHMHYQHTQNGKLIKWVIGASIELIFIIAGMNVWNSSAMAYSLLGVLPVVVLTSRITPHGWLYNVSGLDAVEIQLCSGKKFRIGTDQSSELTSILQGVIKTT